MNKSLNILSDERISKILNAIMEISAGDYQTSLIPSEKNDEIDAITVGMNMLAEEIKATRLSLEELLKEKAEKLTDSENKFSTLADFASEQIFIISKDFVLNFANEASAKIFNTSVENLIGKSLDELFPPEQIEIMKLPIQKVFNTGLPQYDERETSFSNKTVWINTSFSAIFSSDRSQIISVLGISRDITERKIAENKLRESETRFKQISEGAEEWIWEVDPDGVFTYMNQYVKKLLGYNPDELIGIKHFYDFFEPERKEELKQGAFEAFGRKESIRNFINCNIHKDGRNIILSTSGFPILDSENNLIGYRGIDVDITDRQKAEDELKISEMKFRNIVEGTKAILFSTNSRGIFTYLNEAACKILEMTNQELLGKFYLKYIHPEGRAKIHSILSEQLANPTPNKSIDVQILTKSGKEGWLNILINPIYEGGKVVGLSSVALDITERKHTEYALSESEARFRLLFEISADGISIVDVETKAFIYTNPAVCRMLGYTENELKSMSITDIHPKQDLPWIIKEFESLTRGKKSLTLEIPYQRKDGSIIDTELSATITKINGRICNVGIHRDITEKKIAENKLKRSEEQLKQAQQVAHIGSWELDLVKNVGTMSDEMYKIFNINSNSNDVTIETFFDLPIPEDRKVVREIVMKSIETHEPTNIDFRIIALNGEYRWIHEKNSMELDDKGNPKRAYGICQDITERKLAALKLNESEAKLTDAMMVAKLSTWEYNFTLDQFTFNDHFYSLFHTTADQEGGYTMSSGHFAQKFIYPDDRVAFEKEIRKALETPDQAYSSQMEYRIIYTTGEKGFFATNIRIEKDAENRTIKARGVNQDITGRKLMEETLLRINKAVESSSDAVCMSDSQGRHFYHNKAFTENFGYTMEELEAAGGGQTIYADKNIAREVFDVTIKGGAWNGEVEMLSKDNRKFIVWLRANAITDVDGVIVGLVGMNTDITQQKQAETEINEKNKQLVKLNAEKDKFFSIISHDLRSPFQGLIGLTEMVASGDEEYSKQDLMGYFKSIHDSSLSLFKLIENLLAWAQMQSSSMSFTPREIELHKIVSKCIETIKDRSANKGISIINEVTELHKVYADENMLDSVMRNLISNAVKFTKRDGKIFIRSKKTANGMVETSVSDTGVGLSEINLKRLFKVEEKVSSIGTEGEPSTGLGLLLCKEFVEKNGGRIWAESEVNKGSVFHFTIPAFHSNSVL